MVRTFGRPAWKFAFMLVHDTEGQVDHAFFLAVLATVTFTPQTATDATPAASPS